MFFFYKFICTKTHYLAIWKRVSQSNPYVALRTDINQKLKCTNGRQRTSEGINRVMISAALSNKVLTL